MNPAELTTTYEAKSCSCMTMRPTSSPTTPEPTSYPSASPTRSPTSSPTDPCLDPKLTCENYMHCCSDLASISQEKRELCEKVRESAQSFIFSSKPCPPYPSAPSPSPTLITQAPSTRAPTPDVDPYLTAAAAQSMNLPNKSESVCLEWTCTNTVVSAARSIVRPASKQIESQRYRCTQLNEDGTTCMAWTGNFESVKSFTFANCLCLSVVDERCQTWECSEHTSSYVFPNLIIAFGYPICFIMPVILFGKSRNLTHCPLLINAFKHFTS